MSLKEKISARINKEINWPFFILTVLAVILVRNLLEMYSNPFYHIDFSPGYFVFLTTPLFFSAILLSLILLIYYFARLEFRQAFNLGILFFPIILTPPFLALRSTSCSRAASWVRPVSPKRPVYKWATLTPFRAQSSIKPGTAGAGMAVIT